MKAKLNKIGQITIPKKIRDTLQLKPGSNFTFQVTMGGEIILRPEVLISQYKGPPLEFPEVDDVIWRGTVDEYMAWLRDGGPSFFDARRPGEKTFTALDTAFKAIAWVRPEI